jgi:hypothetical protein
MGFDPWPLDQPDYRTQKSKPPDTTKTEADGKVGWTERDIVTERATRLIGVVAPAPPA